MISGIGITDDRPVGYIVPFAPLAPGGTLFAHFGKFLFKARYTHLDLTAVKFDLTFAFAFGIDRPAPLTRKVRPGTRQPGKLVTVSSQFHLQNRFPGAGAIGKNIQNHFLTVDHADFAAEP